MTPQIPPEVEPKPVVTILFTGAGRRVELLRAFSVAHRSLGLGGGIIAVDVDPLAPAYCVAERFELVPRSGDPAYVPRLLELARAHSVTAVFPVIDPDIPLLAAASEEFLELGVEIGTMDSEGVGIAADKWRTIQLFNRIGVPAPQSWLREELPPRDSLSFPLHLKPRSGSASMHTSKVVDPQELEFMLDRTPDPIIQQFLEGPEITCDLAYDFDGGLLGMCQRKRIEVRSGEVQKGVTVWDQRIAAYCLEIGKALKARGPLTIQCLLHEGAPHFTEINGRFGGGLPLAIAAGLDFPSWYLSLLAGGRPETPPLGSHRLGLYMTRCDESFFLSGAASEGSVMTSVERGPWLTTR